MPAPDAITSVLRQWLIKADNDLKTAELAIKAGADCPTDTACFHAQQCAEKCLKALLIKLGVEFPFTHDLGALNLLLPPGFRPDFTPEQADTLTRYATVTRYPGDYEPLSLDEAKDAVKVARRIRDEIRLKLSPDILEA